MREEGFYWVKLKGNNGWTIASLTKDCLGDGLLKWFITGDERSCTDKEFSEIGEKIEEPK